MKTTYSKYRSDIDGLRAVAVLLIVGFHAFPNWFQGGFIGVDIFFVISGFLISGIIFNSLSDNTFSFTSFYAGRIRRIFPALIIVLSACFMFGWVSLLPDEYKQLGKHIAGGAGFISNFILWDEVNYFDNSAETKPLLHLWSLGIEEQFYIIWPITLWISWRQNFNFLAVTLVISIVSFYLNIQSAHTHDTAAAFYSPQTRFWELLIGGALAHLSLFKPILRSSFSRYFNYRFSVFTSFKIQTTNKLNLQNLQSMTGVFCIILTLTLVSKERPYLGWSALLPTCGTALLIASGQTAWFNHKILSHRILVWFGLISYPLYLWHWPILTFARILESELPSVTIRITCLALAILLSWLTYQFIEKPVRSESHKKTKTIVLCLMMASIAYAGYLCDIGAGYPHRFNKLNESNSRANYQIPRVACGKIFPSLMDNSRCILSNPQQQPSIALIGDSHSGYYFNGLTKHTNKSVIGVVGLSCLPFATDRLMEDMKCKKNFYSTLEFLKNQDSIKTVYLAGYWGYLISGGFITKSDNWRIPNPITKDTKTSFIKNGTHLISELIAANKEVILFRDIPDLDFNIRSCFQPFSLTKKLKDPCAIDVADYKKRVLEIDDTLNIIIKKFPTLKIFDPKSTLCDDKLCWAKNNNMRLYKNGDHLSPDGAELILRALLEKK